MDVDGAPAPSRGGGARTPERSQGQAGSAGTGFTPGMRTPMSVPRPEFGRPMGGPRASSFATVRFFLEGNGHFSSNHLLRRWTVSPRVCCQPNNIAECIPPLHPISTPSTPTYIHIYTHTHAQQEDAGDQNFIWGSKFRTADMKSRVRRFLATYYDPSRDAAAASDATPAGAGAAGAGAQRGQPTYAQLLREMVLDGRFGLSVDMADVHACDRLLYQVTVDYPSDMILIWDEEATAAALEIAAELGDAAPPLEEAVQVRPFNLRGEHARAIRDLDPLQLDTLVAVRGMVTRTGAVIPDLRVADFRCDACNGETAVQVRSRAAVGGCVVFAFVAECVCVERVACVGVLQRCGDSAAFC